MIKTTPMQNKALVLQAFDALFNKRDYKAAERYWSSNYIQHSAHIPPGREGLFTLVRSMPASLKYEAGVIVDTVLCGLQRPAAYSCACGHSGKAARRFGHGR